MKLDTIGSILLIQYQRIEKLKESDPELYKTESKEWRDWYLQYIDKDPYISRNLADILYKDRSD